MGGWFDHYCNAALENFTAMRERAGDPQARAFTRCLIGPWTHTGLANPELFGKETTPEAVAADRALRLKERLMENPAVDPLPDEAPVTYYMLGAKEWRTAQTWPPENSAEGKYYLHSSGCVNSVLGNGDLNLAPPADEQFDTCIYNPFQPVPTTGGGFLGGGKNGCLDQSELEKRLDIMPHELTEQREHDDLQAGQGGQARGLYFRSRQKKQTCPAAVLSTRAASNRRLPGVAGK